MARNRCSPCSGISVRFTVEWLFDLLGIRSALCKMTTHDIRYEEHTMSKSQDAKKAQKKVATKTPKEKKEAKKLKKDAVKRQ